MEDLNSKAVFHPTRPLNVTVNDKKVVIDGTIRESDVGKAAWNYIKGAPDKEQALHTLLQTGAKEMQQGSWIVDINMGGLLSTRSTNMNPHDDSLPLVTGLTYEEARSIITLVGRKLWRAEDSPSNRPYVWSWPLPAAPNAAYMEFYMATQKIGPHAIHQAREVLRLHMQVGDLKKSVLQRRSFTG